MAKKELVLVMKSFYVAIIAYLNANDYVVGKGKNEVEILHSYPDDTDKIHLPSISIDHSVFGEDEDDAEMGYEKVGYSLEIGIFTENFFERDQLIATIGDFLKASVPLIDYNAVTPTEYNRIRFEDISHRSVISITEQKERKFAGEITFVANVLSED